MNRLQKYLMGLAAVLGIGGALAFTRRHHHGIGNIIYAESGANYYYTSAKPLAREWICIVNTGTSCTISTTLTVDTLNDLYYSTFPAQNNNPGGPYVIYEFENTLYQH